MPRRQHFRTIYFPDYGSLKKGKGVTLAFGKHHRDIHRRIASFDSGALRNILNTNSYTELERRARDERLPINTYCLWVLSKHFASLTPAPPASRLVPRTHMPIDRLIHRVFEGDCLDILPMIPPKSIDMILCDLPYGTTQNTWDSIIPLDALWIEYSRIIKDHGAIVLTAHGPFTAALILSNTIMFKYKIVWIKSKPTNFLNAKKQPMRKHEDICIFYKRQPTYHPQMTIGEPYNKGFRKDQFTGSYGNFRVTEVKSSGERYPTDVFYCKTAESEGPVYHPTQKPVDLGRYLIRTFTNPGDIILDNACGSGSFLVSAVLEGRKFIGIEKNQEVYLFKKQRINYIDICMQRITAAEATWRATSSVLL